MDQDRLYYSLTEAATLLALKETDLLQYGAQGKIQLMVAVPEQLIVTQYQIKVQHGHIRVIQEEIKPLFLVLKPSYCIKVDTNGETLQSEFPYGYYIADSNKENQSIDQYLLPTYPGKEGDSMEFPEHIWVTIGKSRGSHAFNQLTPEACGVSPDIGSPVHIRISNMILSKNTVIQIRLELEKNKQNKATGASNPIGAQDISIDSELNSSYFPNLVILIKAAKYKWGNADPNEKDTHPTNDTVEKYLKGQGFSTHMASVGSSIIRPNYAIKGRKKGTEKL